MFASERNLFYSLGFIKYGVIPVASSLGNDLVKYGVDSGVNYLQGNEVGGFDVGAALHNAGFSLAWSNIPGKLLFERLERFIMGAGGEFVSMIIVGIYS